MTERAPIRASASTAGGRPRAPTIEPMATPAPSLEDERGVDVSQIRRQLALSVPERVQTMVEAANTLIAVQDRARSQLRDK